MITASYKHPDCIVLVFAKAPVAGKVKTRLVPRITNQQAADLHQEFIHDRLQMCRSSRLCEAQLWCSPDVDHEFFGVCSDLYDVALRQQVGSNLGERMMNAINQSLTTYKKVIIIGTDAPALDTELLDKAIAALSESQVVLVPAEDGGYVLLGSIVHDDRLLEGVSWGGRDVLSHTCQNMNSLNLSYALLEQCWDVDRPEDLERYYDLKM